MGALGGMATRSTLICRNIPAQSDLRVTNGGGRRSTLSSHYLVVDARGAPLDGKRFVREDELSALRVAGFDPIREYALEQDYSRPSVRDGMNAVYRVRGRPSMQSIKQLSIGVRNRAITSAIADESL